MYEVLYRKTIFVQQPAKTNIRGHRWSQKWIFYHLNKLEFCFLPKMCVLKMTTRCTEELVWFMEEPSIPNRLSVPCEGICCQRHWPVIHEMQSTVQCCCTALLPGFTHFGPPQLSDCFGGFILLRITLIPDHSAVQCQCLMPMQCQCIPSPTYRQCWIFYYHHYYQ